MSTGSTQSCASICSSRLSAVIGSATIRRSMWAMRPKSTSSAMLPSFGIAGDHVGRAVVLAVVEDAADADVVVGFGCQRADKVAGRFAAAHDDRPAFEQAGLGPAVHVGGGHDAERCDDAEAAEIPRRHPHARIVVAELGEEGGDGEKREHAAPGEEDAADPEDAAAQRADGVAAQHLREHDGRERAGDDRRGVERVEPVFRRNVEEVDAGAERQQQREFDQPRRAGDDRRATWSGARG